MKYLLGASAALTAINTSLVAYEGLIPPWVVLVIGAASAGVAAFAAVVAKPACQV